jgi:hypothetical protein
MPPRRFIRQRGRGCWPLLLALALAPALASLPRPVAADPGADPAGGSPTCAAPRPGRYVVMGEGELSGEPLARLLLETWNANGTLRGVRLERRGHLYRETGYLYLQTDPDDVTAAVLQRFSTGSTPPSP